MSTVSRLRVRNAALMICDMQEKFRSRIHGFQSAVEGCRVLYSGCVSAGVDCTIVTEQYPKGLGPTVPELTSVILDGAQEHPTVNSNVSIIPKTKFSMYVPEVESKLKENTNLAHILLCGIETHVCVYQTATDLIEKGYNVHIVVDCVSSQREADRAVGIAKLQSIGCQLTTVEMALFELLGDAKHENFKEVSNVVKSRNLSIGQLSLSGEPKPSL